MVVFFASVKSPSSISCYLFWPVFFSNGHGTIGFPQNDFIVKLKPMRMMDEIYAVLVVVEEVKDARAEIYKHI